MSEHKTPPFAGTKEQEEQLKAVLKQHEGDKNAVIAVLHQAQEIYGYLPIEVQKMVADGLEVPLTEVYGVVTFYTQFSLNPKGAYKIGVCLGTACYVKGSGEIFEKIKQNLGIDSGECTEDGKFSLDATRCIAPAACAGYDHKRQTFTAS